MTKIIIVCLAVLILPQIAPAASGKASMSAASEADAAWQQMHVGGPDKDNHSKLRFRRLGLKFFADFPQDPRRWTWLNQTLMWSPTYYESDSDEQANWAKSYMLMRAEMLASTELDSTLRKLILFHELWEVAHQFDANAGLRGPDICHRLWEFCAQWPDDDDTSLRLAERVLARLGVISPDLQQACLKSLLYNPNRSVQQLAVGRLRAYKLRTEPMEMDLPLMDGGRLRLSQLRGSVVLVDFWSTYCSSCLVAMKEIKKVYDRYSDKGFKVVGVSFNTPAERGKVADVLKQLGISWPTSIQGALKDNRYAREFGITYVPAYFLLDANGLLITTDIHSERLETEVRRLLGLPQDRL